MFNTLVASESSVENSISKAELYLVQVLQKDSTCKSFDELRSYQYHYSTNNAIRELSPTSASIKLHILRAFYVTYIQLSYLETRREQLNPLLYGFIYEDNLLMPQKINTLLPPMEDYVPHCVCKACVRLTCCCVRAEIPCCSFCACKKKDTCKNKFGSQK